MNLQIYPKKILKMLLFIISFLVFANSVGIVLRVEFGHDRVHGLIHLFDFDTEGSVPAFYSSLTLLVSSILLFYISFAQKTLKRHYIQWSILSFIFLFLSLDEMLMIHEMFIVPVRTSLDTTGFLYYAWIIPYGILLLILVITYYKFLLELPKKTMVLFLISGFIFVSGAIGFEMLGGWYTVLYGIDGKEGLSYAILYTSEESLEMLGIAIFIYALLSYIGSELNSITLSIKE